MRQKEKKSHFMYFLSTFLILDFSSQKQKMDISFLLLVDKTSTVWVTKYSHFLIISHFQKHIDPKVKISSLKRLTFYLPKVKKKCPFFVFEILN